MFSEAQLVAAFLPVMSPEDAVAMAQACMGEGHRHAELAGLTQDTLVLLALSSPELAAKVEHATRHLYDGPQGHERLQGWVKRREEIRSELASGAPWTVDDAEDEANPSGDEPRLR